MDTQSKLSVIHNCDNIDGKSLRSNIYIINNKDTKMMSNPLSASVALE